MKGKKDLLAFAEEAKAAGASLVAVAKGSKESRAQAQALAKCGLSVKLVNLKRVGRVLPSGIPLTDAQWAAVLAWCLQSQAGRIDEGLRGQLKELAGRFRKCFALHESASMAYFGKAIQSGADLKEIVGKSMGEIGKSILDIDEKGLGDGEALRRLETSTEDEGWAAVEAMDEAIFLAADPSADKAIAKMRGENYRWTDAAVKAHNEMKELLLECGQAGSPALLNNVAGISKIESLPLLAELDSFFSDL